MDSGAAGVAFGLGANATALHCAITGCVDTSNTTVCSGVVDNATVAFPVGSLQGCYCRQFMESLPLTLTALLDPTERHICGLLLSSFGVEQAGNLVSACVVILFNAVLKSVLLAVTRFERHLSISEQSYRLITKTFASQVRGRACVGGGVAECVLVTQTRRRPRRASKGTYYCNIAWRKVTA